MDELMAESGDLFPRDLRVCLRKVRGYAAGGLSIDLELSD